MSSISDSVIIPVLASLVGLSDPSVDQLAAVLLAESTIPSTRATKPRCWSALKRAPGGCAAELRSYAEAFVAAGEAHGLDPWLLAAVAWRESRWIAGSNGVAHERGIMQIHPSRPDARGLPIFDDREWLQCRRVVGQCQAPVIDVAAGILRRATKRCGDVAGGLAAYQSGRCDSEPGRKYATRVMATRDRLSTLRGGHAS